MYTQAWPAVEPPELRGAYVGFWARLWATFLDTILIVIVTYPFLIAVYGWGYLESRAFVEGPIDLLLSLMLPAAAIVVFWIYCAATPGKMAIGARIVDVATGRQPTQWQFVKRYIGYFLSSIPLCWGFIRAAFDPRKQGWHDKLAGTVVVYTKKILATRNFGKDENLRDRSTRSIVSSPFCYRGILPKRSGPRSTVKVLR